MCVRVGSCPDALVTVAVCVGRHGCVVFVALCTDYYDFLIIMFVVIHILNVLNVVGVNFIITLFIDLLLLWL